MPNLAERLLESAAAVAALGAMDADFAILDDATVTHGLALVRDHQRNLQAYELGLAAEIAKRSSQELGNGGLARRNGSATPAIFIQTITGSSIDEATKLARLGEVIAATGRADVHDPSSVAPGPNGSSMTGVAATAARRGEISVAAADAIRKGLGKPDAAVTAERLRTAELQLLADAPKISPETLLRQARAARNALDLDAVERGTKRRHDLRYVRRWQKDGMSGGSWSLPDEDGGSELHAALGLLIAARTSVPRFRATDSRCEADADEKNDDNPDDTRTLEQVLADGFAQIVHLGVVADPSVVPAAERAAVRVIVSNDVIDAGSGSAILEETLTPVNFGTLGQYLCSNGRVGTLFDDNGELVNVGREQRLFTRRQNIGFGVRDGGCRYPGCNKPVSWTQSHHVDEWVKDEGPTDLAYGILLCRYHHRFVHHTASRVIRGESLGKPGTFWLQPGPSIEPSQKLVAMPSKNPLVRQLCQYDCHDDHSSHDITDGAGNNGGAGNVAIRRQRLP